jgi:hypothetical protein
MSSSDLAGPVVLLALWMFGPVWGLPVALLALVVVRSWMRSK